MKKILVSLLIMIFVFGLCACGKDKTDDLLGVWIGEYVYESSASFRIDSQNKSFEPDDTCVMKLELFAGETFQITRTDSVTGAEIVNTGTWEQKDGVIVINQDGKTVGYTYDGKNTLSIQQSGVKMYAKELSKE